MGRKDVDQVAQLAPNARSSKPGDPGRFLQKPRSRCSGPPLTGSSIPWFDLDQCPVSGTWMTRSRDAGEPRPSARSGKILKVLGAPGPILARWSAVLRHGPGARRAPALMHAA